MKSLLQQLRQLWLQLGLNQRVTIAVTSLAVFVGMVGLLVWSQRPQMEFLYGRLGQKDLAAVMTAIQELGVKSETGANGTAIYVPADQVHRVRIHLASKGVLSGDGVGFEIFDRSNFGVSDFIQRTNKTRAIQGELTRTIRQMQGVRDARVHVVMPENLLLFTDSKAKATAAVMVEGSVSPEGVNAIRLLVANAVENLKPDDVKVVDFKGQVLSEALESDPLLGGASTQLRLRKQLEESLSKKVETMLASVLGPNRAVVRVSADLEAESTTRTEEKFDPEGQVVRTETTTDDSTVTNETESPNQPAGATANVPGAGDAGAKGAGKNSEQSKKNKSTNYEINRVVTNSVRAPGNVTRLTAAVFVAKEEKPRESAKLEELRKMVANALGVKWLSDQELAKAVTISEESFWDSPKESQGLFDRVAKYSDLVRDLGAVAVALVLFAVFFSLLRKTKPDEIPMELVYPTGESPISGDAEFVNGGSGAQPVTVDLINEMIRRKPQNVSAAIKNWMEKPETTSTGAN